MDRAGEYHGQPQTCTISATASDAFGRSATGSHTQTVNAVPHTLTITQAPAGTPNPTQPGQAVALSVEAVDTVAHSLSYLWQASCSGSNGNGTFSPNASVKNPTWTPPPNPAGGNQVC